MTDMKDKEIKGVHVIDVDEIIQKILLACGDCSVKEKVTLLFKTIDFLFENNPELIPAFTGEASNR